MADQSPSRRELEELINFLEQRRDQLRTEQADHIELLISVKAQQCYLEDQNPKLEEMWHEMELEVERLEAVNEEMRKRRDFMAQMLFGDNYPGSP